MIKNWNVDTVISQCQQMYFGATDARATGWENWPCKQDLYRVKFAVEDMLAKTSTFVGETEWLREQEQEKMWNKLKS